MYPVYRSDSSRNNRVMRLRSGRDKVEEETGHILTHGNKIEYLKASIDSPPGISLRRQPQAAAHMPINNKPLKGKKTKQTRSRQKLYIYKSCPHGSILVRLLHPIRPLSMSKGEREEEGNQNKTTSLATLRAREEKKLFPAPPSLA